MGLFIHVGTQVVLIGSVFDEPPVDRFGFSVGWFVISIPVKLSAKIPVGLTVSADTSDNLKHLGNSSSISVNSQVHIVWPIFTDLDRLLDFRVKDASCGLGFHSTQHYLVKTFAISCGAWMGADL